MRILLVGLLLVLSSATAVAQESAEEQAQVLFQEAREAYEAGDYALSLAKLREAYPLYPDPVIQVAIARRLLDLDRPGEALAELQAIEGAPRRVRTLINTELTRVREVLAQPVTVLIETNPPGAMVRIGEEAPQAAPIRRTMERGEYTINGVFEGYRPLSEQLVVRGSRELRQVLEFEKLLSTLRVELVGAVTDRDPPLVPFLRLGDRTIDPGATVELESGRHVVTCGYQGDTAPTTLRVNVPPGRAAVVRCALPAPLEEPTSWRAIAGWTTVGSGAAAIGAGVGVLLSYASDASQYSEPRHTLSSSKPVVGGVVTGLGAGLLGLGIYFLLSD